MTCIVTCIVYYNINVLERHFYFKGVEIIKILNLSPNKRGHLSIDLDLGLNWKFHVLPSLVIHCLFLSIKSQYFGESEAAFCIKSICIANWPWPWFKLKIFMFHACWLFIVEYSVFIFGVAGRVKTFHFANRSWPWFKLKMDKK